MDLIITDWLSLILRWAHVMTGIAWIGTSFYFIWLDGSLRQGERAKEGVLGESWMVHGGGFYQVEKYSVAPKSLPKELHWFKYEAYFTWITGILLLAVIYYWGAEAFLIDPSVANISAPYAIALSIGFLLVGWLAYDLLCRSPLGTRTDVLAVSVFLLITAASWGLGMLFSGRAAFLHSGAFIGTIMAANVFFIIIPNQKKTVAALIAGKAPDPNLGKTAKQRSLHNNYLTLPVVLMMVSNHYPLLYANGRGWLMAAGVVVLGGLIRHYFNSRNTGQRDWSYPFLIPAAVLAVILLALVPTLTNERKVPYSGEPITFAQVEAIVKARCVSCHASDPSDESFDEAPGGVVFDEPGAIKRNAGRIYAQSVLSDTMPLGNVTEMTDEERALLGEWYAQGAPDR
ncbi:MAG: urate hydroxylase PuuD [Kiloniellales bacterium]|nr:urate hydroxylase PuuD [Kiloniellales bacterium]